MHWHRLLEIEQEIAEADDNVAYYQHDKEQCLRWAQTVRELEAERAALTAENDLYSLGYEAGREYHDTGKMRDEWLGRVGLWLRGFNNAGQDS